MAKLNVGLQKFERGLDEHTTLPECNLILPPSALPQADFASLRLPLISNVGNAMPLELEKDAPNDFDFVIGDWTVKHRRLKERLKDCHDWIEFEGFSCTRKVLGGFGNIEDNQLFLPEGPYRAIALRSYNKETMRWSIWWLDARFPGALDTPVIGRFTDGIGTFLADDSLDGAPIKVRFRWTIPADNRPRWEQAFSADGGATWETNWTMEFVPRRG